MAFSETRKIDKKTQIGGTVKKILNFGMVFALMAMETASGQGPAAPPRPVCTQTGMEAGACRWNPANGLGPGTRVVISDRAGGHVQSKTDLRNALERLSQRYGFILTRIDSLNDITDTNLSDAKVIIFSSGDGDLGHSIPSPAVRARVEDFVMQRGWGILAVHAACAFVDTWSFLQDVCVQQYNHHNSSGTRATVYVEDRTVDGIGQGRQNPYTSFMLEGFPDRANMQDEWFTWRANPRTTHQFNRESKNKVMLLALDEGSFRAEEPRFPREHYAAWTHTLGPADGIALYYSLGHDNPYIQGNRAYGDTLLWRMLRYAAKDWCQIGQPDCPTPPVSIRPSPSGFARKIFYESGMLSVSLPKAGRYRISVTDVTGKRVHRKEKNGPGSLAVRGLKAGLYFVRSEWNGEGVTERVLVQ